MNDLTVYEAYIDEGRITLIKDQALVYIANCINFIEVKEWSDRAAALEAYARRKGNIKAIEAMKEVNRAAETEMGKRLIAMRESGELRPGGNNQYGKRLMTDSHKPQTNLADLGVTPKQAQRYRDLARNKDALERDDWERRHRVKSELKVDPFYVTTHIRTCATLIKRCLEDNEMIDEVSRNALLKNTEILQKQLGILVRTLRPRKLTVVGEK